MKNMMLFTELDVISLKMGTYIFSIYFAKTKVDSYDSLPIQKRVNLHNAIRIIKFVLNRDKIATTIRYF